jgi:hypothetical protein
LKSYSFSEKKYQKFIKLITSIARDECSAKKTINLNKKFNSDYKKMGYIFISRNRIYNRVSQLL